jgi:hypothetical protein
VWVSRDDAGAEEPPGESLAIVYGKMMYQEVVAKVVSMRGLMSSMDYIVADSLGA